MNELISSTQLPTPCLTHLSLDERKRLPVAVGEFLDTAATATARATFYNTRAEQETAMRQIHQELMALDRGVYLAALLLPGLTDFSRQLGTVLLLSTPPATDGRPTSHEESALIGRLIDRLPPQRMLKLFGMLRREKITNARTRRLILSTLVGSKSLEFWAVKYRRKLETALIHAWGRRTASILRAVLARPVAERSPKERQIVQRQLGQFVSDDMPRAEECVRFILGDTRELTLNRLLAYTAARSDLESGRTLPFETL